MRSLASVQEIASISEIPDALNVELVRFKDSDFVAVCNKNLHKVNTQVVIFEADSIVDKVPSLSWMEPFNYRVKMVRMAGVVSQVIVAPIDILPEGVYTNNQDVTKLLQVTKYQEEEAETDSLAIGAWPYKYAHKTDETRLESLKGLIDKIKQYYPNELFAISEKVEGQSATFIMTQDERVLHSASRSQLVAVKPQDQFDRAITHHNLKGRFTGFLEANNGVESLTIQGELHGPGIAKNYYKLDTNELAVFDIFVAYKDGTREIISIKDTNDWLVNNFNKYGDQAPIWHTFVYKTVTVDELETNLREFVDNLQSGINPDLLAEGVVIRPYTRDINMIFRGLPNSRLTFKMISNRYETEVRNPPAAPKPKKEPKPIPEWALAKRAEAEARRNKDKE